MCCAVPRPFEKFTYIYCLCHLAFSHLKATSSDHGFPDRHLRPRRPRQRRGNLRLLLRHPKRVEARDGEKGVADHGREQGLVSRAEYVSRDSKNDQRC